VEPLELLYEPAGLPAFSLPQELAALYPGTLGFPEDWLYANFVETIDGVVALPGIPSSNRVIADANEEAQFAQQSVQVNSGWPSFLDRPPDKRQRRSYSLRRGAFFLQRQFILR